MKEPDLPAGLSWKRGFLHHKSKGNIGTKARPQVQAKRISKVQCPRVEKTGNKIQQISSTCEAVLSGTDLTMATDPAPSSLQNVTIASAPTIGTCNDFSTIVHTTGSGTTPQTSLRHDDGHIHRASPISGLPPERQHSNGKLAIMHNNKASKSMGMMEVLHFSFGQSLQQNRGQLRQSTTAATLLEANKNTPLIDSPHHQSSLDATEGTEAVPSAINAIFDNQAFKNSQSSQPSADANDLHQMSTSTGERPLDQQTHVRQREGTTTDQAPPLEVKRDGQRALRTRFSWKKGFLKAHKPPTRRTTPMPTQHRRNPSGH